MASSTVIDSGVSRSYIATATLSDNQLVVLASDGTVDIATATSAQDVLGFSDGAYNKGETARIILLNGGGSAYAIASSTVTLGDSVYPALGGNVQSTQVTDAKLLGFANESALQGEVFEVILD